MDSLVQRIVSFSPVWTYLAVALLVFAEEAMVFGLLVPGDTAAIFAGVAASRGHLNLPAAMALVAVSAVVGASVGFAIGKIYGVRVLEWSIFDRYRTNLEKAVDFLHRHGGWAIVFGRFSTFFRTMLPQLVGMSPMSYSRFLVASFGGAVIWGSAMVLAGYLVGQSFAVILKQIDSDLAIVIPVLLILGLAYWKWRQHRQAGKAVHSDPE
ncbi:DedA family protein [Nocardia sp. NBC_01388]|uniref:DedA family protein n=1 Tax=Nocardia sp. NBC_01388 TaxID=2903596 RepID=UPI00325004FF